jgi:hypothetical protein
MKTKTSPARIHLLRPLSTRLRTVCATWLLPLLLLTPPAALQAQLTYVTNNATITITGYTGFPVFGFGVAIPDRLPDPANGLPVTAIGGYAFSSLPVTNVIIPNSVVSIGGYAFDGCKALGKVTIGNSVTTIGDHAFDGCGLGNVIIPNSIISLGDYAFYGCYRMTNLIIPNSVLTIGDYAFAGCAGLTNVMILDGVIIIGDFAFGGCSRLTYVRVPDSVLRIGAYAFQRCALTNFTIGSGLTSIGDHSFDWCLNLTNITIPSSVNSIGDSPFSSCDNLTGVYFEGNAPIGGSLGVFFPPPPPTVYYLPGTLGWGSTFSGCPTMLWNPQAQAAGVRANRFGFNITGTTNIPIVVEASTNLASASWTALQTCTLTNGLIHFSDPQWANYPARFYRLRSP